MQTVIKSGLVYQAHSEKKEYSISYILPFFILLINASVPRIISSAPSDPGHFGFNPINLAILGTAYMIGAWLFFLNIREFSDSLLRNKIYIVAIFFAFSTVLVSNYPSKVVINIFHYIGLTLVIVSAVYYFYNNPRQLFSLLLYFSFVIVTLHLLSAFLFPSIGVHHSQRWMGLTTHPNSLGTIAFISTWISLSSMYIIKSKLVKFISILTIIGALICLYKSNSVTSLICTAFLLFAYPISMTMKSNSSLKIFSKVVILIFIFLTFVLTVYAFFPEEFHSDIIFSSVGREAHLTGRLSLWENGIQAFKMKPIWGWGYDSNASILSRSVISYGQFHNGYLDVAVAGGIIGFMLLTFLMLKFFGQCKRLWTTDFRLSVSFLVFFLSIMLHNISEASFFRQTNIIWLWFVFSLFYLDLQNNKNSEIQS